MGTRPRSKRRFRLERWQVLLAAVIAAIASVVVGLATTSGTVPSAEHTSPASSQASTSQGSTPSASSPPSSAPAANPLSTGPTSSATITTGSVPALAPISTNSLYVTVASQNEAKATVSCPSGTRVTGGGGSGPGVVYLTDSYPVGDSGWTVYAYNPDPAAPHTLQAWAICSSAVSPGANSEYRSTFPTTINPGASDSASVTCPRGTVAVGGGGSGPNVVYLTSSYPGAPGEWVAGAANPPVGSQRTLQARALCGPAPRNFVSSPGEPVSIAPGQVKSASVTCPSGLVQISGGGRISGPGTYLTDSEPKAGGWTVYAVNTGSETTSLTAVVRCASALPVRLRALPVGSGSRRAPHVHAPVRSADAQAVGISTGRPGATWPGECPCSRPGRNDPGNPREALRPVGGRRVRLLAGWMAARFISRGRR